METSSILLGWVWLDEFLSPTVTFLNDFQRGYPVLLAILLGFVSGFLIGIPVGPVNLTIMNEGARFGFIKAALISIGATIMESLYCAIALTSFAAFVKNEFVRGSIEVFTFIFLMFLGIKFLTTKSVTAAIHISAATDKLGAKIGAKIEKKFHPHSAFMMGFVRTLANPGILIFWIFIAVTFAQRGWLTPDWPGKCGFVAGVFGGVGAWFLGLSYAASLGYGKFSDKTLLKIERFSGVSLIIMALIHGGLFVREMILHKG